MTSDLNQLSNEVRNMVESAAESHGYTGRDKYPYMCGYLESALAHALFLMNPSQLKQFKDMYIPKSTS